MNRNIGSAFSCAVTEYIKWITNPRIIILGVLFVFIYTFISEPLLEHAEKMGIALNIAEPFIAAGNSSLLSLLLPLVFLLLISDYPTINNETIFIIYRVGKVNWLLGQFIFLFSALITILLSVFLVGAVTSNGVFSPDWSDTVTKYISVFPNEHGSFAAMLIPSNLYNQMNLAEALINTIVLQSLNLYILSLTLYIFRICGFRNIGLFIDVAVIALGYGATSIGGEIMWAFPMANTLVWLHHTEILSTPIFPVWCSYLYLSVVFVGLVIGNLAAIKRKDLLF